MSLAREFSIKGEFPPVSYSEWRSLVEEGLQGVPFEKKLVTRTYEGIDIQPVYTSGDVPGEGGPHGFPGMRPYLLEAEPLGRVLQGLDLRQQYSDPDSETTNRSILVDLAGGGTSIELHFDGVACAGLDLDEEARTDLVENRGVMLCGAEELASLLSGVDLQSVAVALVSGAAYLPLSATLVAVWKRSGTPLDRVRGAFNSDPMAVLAREGVLPGTAKTALEPLADLAKWSAEQCPQVTSVGVDTSPYHDAGATTVQDLAVALATGVAYLRVMTQAGLHIDSAAGQILFRLSVGTHHFRAIAKLRAARKLWDRVLEAAGGAEVARCMKIQVRVGERVLTQRDPYSNILRNATAVFAACLGGADVVTSVPLDSRIGPSDEASRRIARNTLRLLEEEAHLNRTIDPAGGSWFLDKLTNELASEAWRFFQEIERRGGMLSVLETGWLRDEIASAYATRANDIARRKQGITGVSEFPNLAEEPISREPRDRRALREAALARCKSVRLTEYDNVDFSTAESRTAVLVEAAQRGATIGQLARALGIPPSTTTIEPFELQNFARPFEELRDATDAWQVQHGSRPRVFLAAMGPAEHCTPRVAYAKNFFQVGGFEVVSPDGFREASAAAEAFASSGASIAVICSSDRLYPELVPELAPKLKAAGARSVVLAGNPGDNESTWRKAGVDRFVFMKCDVLATLQEMLQEEGVWQP